MATFYLNELLPERSEVDVCTVFESIVNNTAKLIAKLHMTNPIITCSTANKLSIAGSTLSNIILKCKNRNTRQVAHYMFSHNIIREHESSLTADDVNLLLNADYKYDGYDALNLAIAHKMEWPILSIPLNESLQREYLTLISEKEPDIEAINYFGQNDTTYIEQWVLNKKSENLNSLTRFKALFGEERILMTSDFETNWGKATLLLQDLAYKRFKYAVEKNMIFPIRADDALIKKVDINERAIYELRQKGQGLRIYFGYSKDGSKIIMGGFHTKAESVGEEQSQDIRRADGQINKVLATHDFEFVH